ncbi:MAG: hypothetical protein LIP77_10395 [Planctomycetes bacterium]|nr:hypothetical protein [Planctomycetota bacterium]
MRKNLFSLFLVVAASIVAGAVWASDVATLLASQSANQAEPVWQAAESLARIGFTASAEFDLELVDAAGDPARPPVVRLTAAAALLKMGDQKDGVLGLESVIMDDSVPVERRLEAAQILGKWGGEYAAARLGIMLGAPGVPERVRVDIANALWQLSARPQAFEVLDDIRRNGESPAARAEALLILAQTEHYATLRDDLRLLADMPGPIGERAANILTINTRYDERQRRDSFPVELLTEVIDKVREYYAVDEEDAEQAKRLQPRKMAETSAQALLYSLDQFSDYLNDEDYADFEAQIKANYGGIGAWVGMRDGRFTVLTPMYDKPAHRAGLKPMDVIDRIDDIDITTMKLNEIIKLLKGPAKTTIKVRVYRRAWKEPREIAIKREIIQINSVESQLLPGDIGYIKINSFNDGDPYRRVKGTAQMVKDALAAFNKQGAKGVVLDLSNNPGGVMASGVDVAKLFIGNGKVIVSSRGKKSAGRQAQVYKAGLGSPFYNKPVVVVVNPGTASAAEILAGAMRDHQRAPLVGRKTYGKGSVQSLIGVRAANDRSRIKMTIAKYYLPNGDCIHEKGIEPDYKVPESDLSVVEAEARWKIRDQHDVMFWLEENDRFTRHEQEYRRLLEFDNLDPEAYPEFESLLMALREKYPKEKIDPELVRKEMRFGIASYIKDFQGENRLVDLEENPYLQEAVVVLGDMIGGLPDTPLFATIRTLAEENRRKLADEDGDLAEGN